MGMAIDDVISILNQLRKMGTFSITLTGGEIFLRNDLKDIISYARKIGMSVSLFSNASIKIDEQIADFLDRINIHLFSTTIFSLIDDVHDSITGIAGSLRATLNTLSVLSKKGIPIEVKIPIMRMNIDSYYSIILYCKDNRFLYRVETNITPRNDGDSSPVKLQISEEQLQEVIRKTKKKDELCIPRQIEDYACATLRSSIFVSCNGDVYPCVAYPISMGNVKAKTIEEIWNDKKYGSLRSRKVKDFSKCCTCENLFFCNTCPANYYMYNYTNEINMRCPKSNEKAAMARRYLYERREQF